MNVAMVRPKRMTRPVSSRTFLCLAFVRSEAYSKSEAGIGRVTAAINLCRIPQDPGRTVVFDGRDWFAGMLLCTWQEYASVKLSSWSFKRAEAGAAGIVHGSDRRHDGIR